jgi:hypothetical protein
VGILAEPPEERPVAIAADAGGVDVRVDVRLQVVVTVPTNRNLLNPQRLTATP